MTLSTLDWLATLLTQGANPDEFKTFGSGVLQALTKEKSENRNKQINRLFRREGKLVDIYDFIDSIIQNGKLDAITLETASQARSSINKIQTGSTPSKAWGLNDKTGPDSPGWVKAVDVESLYQYLVTEKSFSKKDAIEAVESITGMDLSDIYKAIEGKGSAMAINPKSAMIQAAIACSHNKWWDEASHFFDTKELESIYKK